MKQQEPVESGQTHEWRGGGGRHEGLPEIQAVWPVVGPGVPMDERKCLVETIGGGDTSLQVDPLRTGVINLIEAFQIMCLEREVAVVCHAQGHGDVGGFVALDAKPRPDDVDRERSVRTDDEHHDRRQSARVDAACNPEPRAVSGWHR